MKILWLANIPSPYRVKFFNELGKYCDLTVIFEKASSEERDESWKNNNIDYFKAIYLKGKSVGVAEAFCPSVIKYLNHNYDHIVVTNYADPTGMMAVFWMKVRRIAYEIEGDGAFPHENKGIKSAIKKFLFKGAVTCFSTANLHDDYYLKNGVDKSLIVRYPFTSISKEEIAYTKISEEEKMQLKKDLSIPERKIVLAVGQFIYRKGYDVLIDAAALLDEEYGFYVIGGTPSTEYVDRINRKHLTNFHFIDFMESNELKKYFSVADVFVHPTREDIWGLVINEAMANGLPIVTTNRCIAGLEMVKDDDVGVITEINNPNSLASGIEVLYNKHNRKKIIEVAKQYTIENMVKRHLEIWNA